MSMRYVAAAAAALVVGTSGFAGAAVIANWGFETVTPPATPDTAAQGPFNPDAGAGGASGVHVSALTDWTTPSGNGSATGWNSNTWAAGDYYRFEVSTAGFEDINVAWDQTRSSNGPATWDLQYATSTAGPFTTFVDDYTVPIAATWTSQSADLSSITSIDNGTVVFRLVAQTAGVNAGGQSRVDNIIISGTAIPEPATCLVGAFMLPLLLRRRRRTS
jgi:hypothetical protein